MDNLLGELSILISTKLSSADDGSFILLLVPREEERVLLEILERNSCIQEITADKEVLSVQGIPENQEVSVELIKFALTRFGYYDTFEEFVNANEFLVPEDFYIREIAYRKGEASKKEIIEGYYSAIRLIDCLDLLSLFQSKEDERTLYFLQEKAATAMKVGIDITLVVGPKPNSEEVSSFADEIESSSERKKIYLKELIDFLNEQDYQDRFSKLYGKFTDFYHRCQSAYGFFLSDFSYSKLKLELESSILDYSKNIRSIINDSQTKLIAIPAAFLVASSQLDLEHPISLKNFLIVFSSVIFSILIEIFLRNQESSLAIFIDNINNYKTTFRLKNQQTDEKENRTLQEVISASFIAIDRELDNQRKRLNIIRIINWGMSFFLVAVIFILFRTPLVKEVMSGLLRLVCF